MVVSTYGDDTMSDGLEVCSEAGGAQGLIGFGVVDVVVEELGWSRRVEKLKYHVGAVKVVDGDCGVGRVRTSSSRYPWRSCIQII